MKIKLVRKVLPLSACLLLAACSNKLVFNEDFRTSGPLFVEAKEPAPEPVPEPAPEPEPIPEPSINELNERAVASFTEVGLEAEVTDRGVNVYLPPEIYFEGSTASIGLEARAKIAQIANEVNQDYLKDRLIEISGHTDSTGGAEANLALSEKRAISATGELVFSQVERTRLKTTWKGETDPRYPELRADGSVDYKARARNRRVEFTILNPGEG